MEECLESRLHPIRTHLWSFQKQLRNTWMEKKKNAAYEYVAYMYWRNCYYWPCFFESDVTNVVRALGGYFSNVSRWSADRVWPGISSSRGWEVLVHVDQPMARIVKGGGGGFIKRWHPRLWKDGARSHVNQCKNWQTLQKLLLFSSPQWHTSRPTAWLNPPKWPSRPELLCTKLAVGLLARPFSGWTHTFTAPDDPKFIHRCLDFIHIACPPCDMQHRPNTMSSK